MQPTNPTMEQAVAKIHNWSQRTRPTNRASVVTIPFIIGAGSAVLTNGVQACLPIFFDGRLVGIQIQEFDGNVGSVTLDIKKFTGGSAPVATSMVGTAGTVPTITNDRFYRDLKLTGWNNRVRDGDYIEILITSVAGFQRLSVALRLRKTEQP